MGNTNIGYGIVNLESFREYAERGKKLARDPYGTDYSKRKAKANIKGE